MCCFSKVSNPLRVHLQDWKNLELGDFAYNCIDKGVDIDLSPKIEPFHFQNRDFSSKQKDFIRQELKDLKASDTIQQCDYVPKGVSPIRPIPKKGGKQRLIINLRHLNAFSDPPKFQYEDINKVLLLAQPGDDIVTVDLKSGFHHVPVSEKLSDWLGFSFEGKYYRYKALPFGANFSPYFFHKLLRPVISHLRQKGLRVAIYVDDIILFARPEEIQEHRQILLSVLARLGWQVNWEKSSLEPSKCKEFLGFRIITDGPDNCVWLKLLPKKVAKLKHDIRYLINKGGASARGIAKVTGSCIAMSRAIMPAKLMLRNVYRLLSHRESWDTHLELDQASVSDLQWWIQGLQGWDGRAISNRPPKHQMSTDASQTGWGAVLAGNKEASGHWDNQMSKQASNVREISAVLLGIMSFKDELKDSKVQILTDNVATAAYVNYQGGTAPTLDRIARSIWTVAVQNRIEIQARYLAGSKNTHADRLSRVNVAYEWELHSSIYRKLDRKWGPHTIDRFASCHNRKTELYNSRFLDPYTNGVDALAQTDWGEHNNWVNPPFRMIGEILDLLDHQQATATIVAPVWMAQAWYTRLVRMSIDSPVQLPVSKRTMIPSGHIAEPLRNPKWRLYAWRVSGKRD